MSFENKAGIGVHNIYGPRKAVARGAGELKTFGALKELEIAFTGETLMSGSALLGSVIPASAMVVDAYVECDEAFTLGAAKVNVGTKGSAATNGIELTAKLGAVGAGTLDTKKGTYAARLVAGSELAVEASGTVTGITKGGKGKVVVRYLNI